MRASISSGPLRRSHRGRSCRAGSAEDDAAGILLVLVLAPRKELVLGWKGSEEEDSESLRI